MTTITMKATFDGSSFTIHDPINLEPNTDNILTIEKEERTQIESPLEVLRNMLDLFMVLRIGHFIKNLYG